MTTINPAVTLYAGTDDALVIDLSAIDDITGYTFAAYVYDRQADVDVVTVAHDAMSIDAVNRTVTAPLSKADTAGLYPGTDRYRLSFRRVDPGSEQVLATAPLTIEKDR